MTGWTDSFGCSSCGRNFATQAALTKHVNRPYHPYKCALCKTHYADIGMYRLHLELAHSGYMCTFESCPYWSATESEVDEHSQKHAQDQKDADLKARKFGNQAGPEGFLKSSRRTASGRDAGEQSSSVPPGSDRSRRKAGVPTSSSTSTGHRFDPHRMVCPFRLANPKLPQNDSDDPYASCRMLHGDILSLIRHLSEPVHGLEVTLRTVSSFNVGPTVPPLRKAGMCRKCWKTFGTATDLSTHLIHQCKTPELTTLDKHGILYDTFARPNDRAEETMERVSTMIEDQTSPDVRESRVREQSTSVGNLHFPKSEEKFIHNFTCCDRTWPTLHDLVQHYEEGHTQFVETARVDEASGESSTALRPVAVDSTSHLPELEEKFMRNFSCCDRTWPTLHDLLQHYEEGHTLSVQPVRMEEVSGKSSPACLRRVADMADAPSAFVDATLKAPSAELEESRLGHRSREGVGETPLLRWPEAPQQALDASDRFVLFPQDGSGKTNFHYTGMFYPSSTRATTSPSQVVVPSGNGVCSQYQSAANSEFLSAVLSPEVGPSTDGSPFQHGLNAVPGPNHSIPSISPAPHGSSSSATRHIEIHMPFLHWVKSQPSAREQPTNSDLFDEGYDNFGVSGKSSVVQEEVVYCSSCGHEWYRKRETDLLCPQCHASSIDITTTPATGAKEKVAVPGIGTQETTKLFGSHRDSPEHVFSTSKSSETLVPQDRNQILLKAESLKLTQQRRRIEEARMNILEERERALKEGKLPLAVDLISDPKERIDKEKLEDEFRTSLQLIEEERRLVVEEELAVATRMEKLGDPNHKEPLQTRLSEEPSKGEYQVRLFEDLVRMSGTSASSPIVNSIPKTSDHAWPPPPLPPPRFVPLRDEASEYDQSELRHRAPVFAKAVPGTFGFEDQAIATASPEAAHEDNAIQAKDNRNTRVEKQGTDSTASRPSDLDLERGFLELPTLTEVEPVDDDDFKISLSSWPAANGHRELSPLPRQNVQGPLAQTSSGHASAVYEKVEGSILGNSELGYPSHRDIRAVAAQTDSGYASLTRGKEGGPPIEPLDLKESSPRAHTDTGIGDDDNDVGTIYSDDRSQTTITRTQCYISEFVDHLFGKIRHQMEACSASSLIDCLPELLQAFALKVGQSPSTRGNFEVMYFVHKHRRAITLSLQDRLKQEQAHTLAEVEDRGTDIGGMSLDDKLHLWAQKAADAEPDHEYEADDLLDIEPLEDELDVNELYRYHSLIMASPAFDWLVGSMQREIHLANSAAVGMMYIRRKMLQGLPSPRHVSRKHAVPSVQVIFTAPWDPISFIEEQGYDPDIEDILGKVITLTGSSADVQAATCEQYLCQTWPSTGKHMLRIIGDTIQRKEAHSRSAPERRTYVLADNTRITATYSGQTLTLEASGTAYSMVEIGEQLGWLTTALRSSTDEGRISVYCPTVEMSQSGADPTLPFSFNISASLVGCKDAPVGPEAKNGKCWQKLFRNPVVVWGYPIPRRQEVITGTGLEIPLDMLVALTDASGLSEFDGRLFIKGYSAMLIPTRQVDDLILWHLLYNEDGARISYADCRLAALDHIQTTAVKQARHILGWVTHARNNTGSPDANYHIKWSGLGKPRERHAWEKVIISGGDPVGVSASFVIGKKDKGIFSGALGGYTSRLKFIAKQYVVLYDLGDRRAWLVDGLSALLHLVRASLEHDQRDVFNSFFLYKQGQIKECLASMHGLDAAAAVLFNPENYSLKLYTESEDTWDEETERKHNGAQGTETVKEVISKRKVTYYCLRDKVLEVFSLLEKMIEHLNNVQSEGGVGFRLRGTPRNILEGFDFMDVATSNAPLRPHMIKLNICESGRGWTDLLRSIQAITLFGKGFGELISPSTSNVVDPPCDGCGYGISLPIGRDYLATCVSLVERILTTRGSTESVPWCMADDIYWHTPGALFDPCQCAHASKGSKPRDRVQVLLPSTYPKLWGRGFASPTNLESQGAVIFSHNWRVPFRLGHQASQDQKMLEPPDSGLGTSIDSSSGRSQLSGSFDDSETQVSNPADESSVRSVGSPIEDESVLDVIGPGQEPEIVTSSRKRKLVDMVDRVKRKVLKTSPNIGLDRLPDDGASQGASISVEGTGVSGGSGSLTEKDKATIL